MKNLLKISLLMLFAFGLTACDDDKSYDDPGLEVSLYNLSTDESLGSVIRGMYDYENGDWNHRYIIRNLFSDRMTWIATDDAQNVSVYKRCPGVPQEILDAYKDEIEAEESEK